MTAPLRIDGHPAGPAPRALAVPAAAGRRSDWASRLRGGWTRAERSLDRWLGGAQANPLRHLGAIACLLFALLVVSGIYLYAAIDTSAGGAWTSIDRLSREQWYLGGVLRSVHRYAADAFVLVIALHVLREGLFGRFRGFRRFSWLTGVPLIGLVMVSAIGGFWLNWDQLGQYSAMATAELLDALPLFTTPLARNFLDPAAVSDRLFSLFVFVHLGVPLLLVFALWFHLQRLSRPLVLPPRAVALPVGLMLLALALLQPVTSQPPAALAQVPARLALDWWLLALHPLADATSPALVWALLLGALALLVALPFLPRRVAAAAVAKVDPANCSGCRRCFDDCPYGAITMVPHPQRRAGHFMAEVDADLCASCGICAGACPSSTPFRRAQRLVSGIDLPFAPIGALREQLLRGLQACAAPRPIVAFGCERAASVRAIAAPDLVPLELVCLGALPPSFVEYALRDGAAGVLLVGCRGCEFRFGRSWTEQRLQGAREPHLRASVPRDRLALRWADADERAAIADAAARLRARLNTGCEELLDG